MNANIPHHELFEKAVAVIRENDRGTYTVPTKGLYPFQWNWDSCLTALGIAHYDEDRAWTEIETLFAHQWPDGMVPHIVFHEDSGDYFPGPEVWRTGRPVPTSGITQPPVAGFAVKILLEKASNKVMARERARSLLPKIDAWHRWFYDTRDPGKDGLVAIIHPWESGRDNSIDWDDAFERVPTYGIDPYVRRDTRHANPAHRPTKEQYDRYVWLLQHFRSLGWDTAKLHDASPFKVVDPGFNAILIRSCSDLADLANELDEPALAQLNRSRAERGIVALESLWSDVDGQYICFDRAAQKRVASRSVGGLLPVFCGIPKTRVQAISRRIEEIGHRAAYLVPSHDLSDMRFDAKRYWRGPVWLIVNYMIANGLARHGENMIADKIMDSSIRLIREAGFAEYYDPTDGSPLGGSRFTWTAAMVIAFLRLR